MATRIVIELIDDLDGSEATETVRFGLDGADYEIDLAGQNADELRGINDLRHTHESWMIACGMDPFQLSHRLGHQSTAITDGRFAPLIPSSRGRGRHACQGRRRSIILPAVLRFVIQVRASRASGG